MTGPSPGSRTAAAIVAALVVGLAVWWGWPAGGDRRWRVFQDQTSVQIVHLSDHAVSANVQTAGGRIVALEPVQLVFREGDDAVALSADASVGDVSLALGGGTAVLRVRDVGLELQVTAGTPGRRVHLVEDAAVGATDAAREDTAGEETAREETGEGESFVRREAAPWRAGRLRLAWVDGHYHATVEGVAVVEPLPGPRPVGRTWIELREHARVARAEAERADGPALVVAGLSEAAAGIGRAIWAGLAALLGLVCLRARVHLLRQPEAPRGPAWVVGALAALALLAGTTRGLEWRNLARIAAPTTDCATTPLEHAGAPFLSRGRTLGFGERLDGDYELRADFVLAGEAALELRVRADPLRDRQVLVTLSSDPALASGLALNLGTSLTIHPTDGPLTTLSSDEPHSLRMRAHEERIEVWVDDVPLGEIEDLDLRTGRSAFHVLSGVVRIDAVSLVPEPGPPGGLAEVVAHWQSLAAMILGAAFAALTVTRVKSPVRWLWCWPLAVAVWPEAPAGLLFPAAGLSALLLLVEWPGQRGGRASLLVLGGLLLGCALQAATRAPEPFSPGLLNQLSPPDVSGDALPAAYVWARHPLLRRFNNYVKTQEYRSGPVAPRKAAGRTRIVAVGSSSTFGYGVDEDETFSAYLQRRLGPDVEVINGGVPGSVAERLRFFVEGVLLDLDPDVLIVDLSYNDHASGYSNEEREHFAAMTSTGLSAPEQWWAAWKRERRLLEWNRTMNRVRDGATPTAEEVERFGTTPARDFELSLEGIVDAAESVGAAVVLVQEPVRVGRGTVILAEYHAAMARLASRRGLLLVDPSAALDAAGEDAFVDVVHPAAEGHRLIAADLARALREAGLVGD